ncbi:DUF3644 domain-containing protein [Limosilactobacillus reuteri]|uniref:DUF3644 domain-containing protein n=1 Tax=Limosilactobacillus reuteri TaxID=1598 RepID=UPI001E2C2946|nr:DUF3644 domain-containing protein [Limosilactobacillus reuteri]MCC4383277.1 DUF3644 domain-containing protein [Limosilactobacillus reuteri]MCC4420114.1 DUF3644 domain-containing protein [Limosilactobacillus reuteri]
MKKEELANRLVNKSIEAFLMGLEVFNKPTINYRTEGFAFFICNAWELMLKAELLKRGLSIYYKNQPDRTYDLSKVIHLIYTDKRQPLRVNLEKIINLRNTSTHFITEDYEAIYSPLFQSCVVNYVNELLRFHDKDVSNYLNRSSLTLTTNIRELSSEQIKAKYPEEIAQKLIFTKNDIDVTKQLENSSKFSITIKHELVITKDKSKANFSVRINKDAKNDVAIIKELKDPADVFKFSFTNLVKDIDSRLKKAKIPFCYTTKNGDSQKKSFNAYVLNLFISYYDMKNNDRYSYAHKIGKITEYTYSQQAAEFIVNQIKQEPAKIVNKIKKR